MKGKKTKQAVEVQEQLNLDQGLDPHVGGAKLLGNNLVSGGANLSEEDQKGIAVQAIAELLGHYILRPSNEVPLVKEIANDIKNFLKSKLRDLI